MPIVAENKTPVGVTLVLADVTNLRRLDEMKSGLLAVVSHELKTPLTSIRMATLLLLERRIGALVPKQIELLEAARDDAERLCMIIENLLDIGRLESGRAMMDLKAVSVSQLVDGATEIMASTFRDRAVTLKTAIPSDLPKVLADPARIDHVFTNLLGNALKFSGPGGVVTVSASRNQGEILIYVEDTGIGIPESFHEQIFDRFFRVPNPEAPSGAGLVLAIAREIVEAHGGRLWLERSVEGVGSTFAFTLQAAT